MDLHSLWELGSATYSLPPKKSDAKDYVIQVLINDKFGLLNQQKRTFSEKTKLPFTAHSLWIEMKKIKEFEKFVPDVWLGDAYWYTLFNTAAKNSFRRELEAIQKALADGLIGDTKRT